MILAFGTHLVFEQESINFLGLNPLLPKRGAKASFAYSQCPPMLITRWFPLCFGTEVVWNLTIFNLIKAYIQSMTLLKHYFCRESILQGASRSLLQCFSMQSCKLFSKDVSMIHNRFWKSNQVFRKPFPTRCFWAHWSILTKIGHRISY